MVSTHRKRPGRRLHPDSQIILREYAAQAAVAPEIIFVISDGLSALAVEHHALPLLNATLGLLGPGLRAVGPVCVVQQGRVVIGDEIGELLREKLIVLLIGERPGPNAADSLGVYLTWAPRRGRTDAERNCISDIRHEGLCYAEAAQRLVFYINEAKRLENTGIVLKEASSLGKGSTSGYSLDLEGRKVVVSPMDDAEQLVLLRTETTRLGLVSLLDKRLRSLEVAQSVLSAWLLKLSMMPQREESPSKCWIEASFSY